MTLLRAFTFGGSLMSSCQVAQICNKSASRSTGLFYA